MAASERDAYELKWGDFDGDTRDAQVEYLRDLLDDNGLMSPDNRVLTLFQQRYDNFSKEDLDGCFTELKRRENFRPEDLQRDGEGCNYQPVKVLGEGLHSCVVLAKVLRPSRLYDPHKETFVALKHVKKSIFAYSNHTKRKVTEIYIKRILRELKIFHYTQNHKHISRMLDVWAPGRDYIRCETLYSVTELCKCDFQDIFDKKVQIKLNYELILKWAYQMCEALNILHFADIVHRDIKPDNILLDNDLNVKLTDFNLGRWVDSSNTSQSSATSFFTRNIIAKYYRPFEVYFRMDGKTRSKVPQSEATKIDVWCIGLIIYELLTLWHNIKPRRLIDPRRRPEGRDPKFAEANQYCNEIVRTVGFEENDDAYFYGCGFSENRVEHYQKIGRNARENFREGMYENFSKIPEDLVQQKESLVDCLLDMIQLNPRNRPELEKILGHACFNEERFESLRDTRTSREHKAVELLRYVLMFDGMKAQTENFFKKNQRRDVYDLAVQQLRKETKWMRGLSLGIRNSLQESYNQIYLQNHQTRLAWQNFVKSHGAPFNKRKADQYKIYQAQNKRAPDSAEEFYITKPKWFAEFSNDEAMNIAEELEWVMEEGEEGSVEIQNCLKQSFGINITLEQADQYIAYVNSGQRSVKPQWWVNAAENLREDVRLVVKKYKNPSEELIKEIVEICHISEREASKFATYYYSRNLGSHEYHIARSSYIPHQSVPEPRCYALLTRFQKDHVKEILGGITVKNKKLLDHVQDETGWSKEDCETVVDWFLTNEIGMSNMPAPSNVSNQGVDLESVDEIHPVEHLAAEGKHALFELEIALVNEMHEWIEEKFEMSTYNPDELDTLYKEFEESFEQIEDGHGKKILISIYIEYLLADTDCNRSLVTHTLCDVFYFHEEEVSKYIEAYMKIQPKGQDPESSLYQSAYKSDVLKEGNFWIFDFDKQRHVTGNVLKKLMMDEVRVFEERNFTYKKVHNYEVEPQKPDDGHMAKLIQAIGMCPDQENLEEVLNVVMDNLKISEEKAEGYLSWYYIVDEYVYMDPIPVCYEQLPDSEKTKLKETIGNSKSKSRKIKQELQNQYNLTSEDTDLVLDWYMGVAKTSLKCPEAFAGQQSEVRTLLKGTTLEDTPSLIPEIKRIGNLDQKEAKTYLRWYLMENPLITRCYDELPAKTQKKIKDTIGEARVVNAPLLNNLKNTNKSINFEDQQWLQIMHWIINGEDMISSGGVCCTML